MLSLIVLVCFPFLIWQAYKQVRLARASSSWPTAPGVVTAAERTKFAWRTQPRVTFAYSVGGNAYSSSTISPAKAVPAKETEPILARYPVSQPVTVHYKPDDPAVGFLEPGPNRYVTGGFYSFIYLYVVIVLINVAYLSLAVWDYKHPSDGDTSAPTYDDTAKADPGLGDRLIREDADKGNAQDEVYVGVWYLGGTDGYAKDPAQAATWFRKAADQGFAEGESMLGQLYARGDGVEKDPAQAISWLKKAADQGEPHACYGLGMASEKGWGGMPQDQQAAIDWYRKAGDEPHAKAALARLGAQ